MIKTKIIGYGDVILIKTNLTNGNLYFILKIKLNNC